MDEPEGALSVALISKQLSNLGFWAICLCSKEEHVPESNITKGFLHESSAKLLASFLMPRFRQELISRAL